MPPVFRFAPSPNGYLHLGHAYSALLNFDLARRRGGRFLLRIEDIDATRCRPEFEAAIYEDLSRPFAEQSMSIRYVPVRPEGKTDLYAEWAEAQTRQAQGKQAQGKQAQGKRA